MTDELSVLIVTHRPCVCNEKMQIKEIFTIFSIIYPIAFAVLVI